MSLKSKLYDLLMVYKSELVDHAADLGSWNAGFRSALQMSVEDIEEIIEEDDATSSST